MEGTLTIELSVQTRSRHAAGRWYGLSVIGLANRSSVVIDYHITSMTLLRDGSFHRGQTPNIIGLSHLFRNLPRRTSLL